MPTTNHILKPRHSHHVLRAHLPVTRSNITSQAQSHIATSNNIVTTGYCIHPVILTYLLLAPTHHAIPITLSKQAALTQYLLLPHFFSYFICLSE